MNHEITSKRKYLAPLFELMVTKSGGFVHAEDYMKASGFTGMELRSALGGLTHYIVVTVPPAPALVSHVVATVRWSRSDTLATPNTGDW